METDNDQILDYYFTFGIGHPLGKCYIKVTSTYEGARLLMTEYFGTAWGFQYRSKSLAGVDKYKLFALNPLIQEDLKE